MNEKPVDRRVRKTKRQLRRARGVALGGAEQNHFAKHGITGIVVSSAMHDVHTVHEYTKIDELVSLAGIVLRLMTGE